MNSKIKKGLIIAGAGLTVAVGVGLAVFFLPAFAAIMSTAMIGFGLTTLSMNVPALATTAAIVFGTFAFMLTSMVMFVINLDAPPPILPMPKLDAEIPDNSAVVSDLTKELNEMLKQIAQNEDPSRFFNTNSRVVTATVDKIIDKRSLVVADGDLLQKIKKLAESIKTHIQAFDEPLKILGQISAADRLEKRVAILNINREVFPDLQVNDLATHYDKLTKARKYYINLGRKLEAVITEAGTYEGQISVDSKLGLEQ